MTEARTAYEEYREGIIQEMVRKNVSIKMMSRKCGVHRSHLQRILNGTQKPRIDTASKIAEAIGMELKLQ